MLSLHAKKLVLIRKICIYKKHVIKDFKQIAGWINILRCREVGKRRAARKGDRIGSAQGGGGEKERTLRNLGGGVIKKL